MEDTEMSSPRSWIAIEPPINRSSQGDTLPSFPDSQFGIILRRQRLRPIDNSGSKNYGGIPSRFINLSNSFEFAGWGSVTSLKLTEEDRDAGKAQIECMKKRRVLGQFTASALAGNDILGGIFYVIPAVVGVGGIYSPISQFIATLILFLWRPIMEELASALPMSGGPYTYLLNVSSKRFALIAASLLLLDFASTVIVSAATAAAYLAGEVSNLPFPSWVGAVIILVLFTMLSLSGVRETARIALVVLILHLTTMAVLIIASSIHWANIGTYQLKVNWDLGRSETSSTSSVAKQIFYGVCLGMLGLTGFECAPSYTSCIKPGKYPLVLRNLHLPAIFLNTFFMILVLAIIPMDVVKGGANVLSVLAQLSAGRWLRIWVVIDAVIVLCGGVLTGILSACELLEQLASHRVIPQVFLRQLPVTRSPYIAVSCFAVFSGVLYASAGASLNIISDMFSLVWLTVMALFPISLILLKFNRGRLPRDSETKLMVILGTLLIVPAVFAGNIAINPQIAGYFLAYFIAIVVLFSAAQNKIHLLRWVYWLYDQYPILHDWKVTHAWESKLITLMTRLRRRPLCILAKTDEINQLFHMILYIQKNEETSHLKIIHFYEEEDGIPSELEANSKILDEAFPEITIDLILVAGSFEPDNVASLAHHLKIPPALMFMSCPGPDFPYSVAEFGTRITSL